MEIADVYRAIRKNRGLAAKEAKNEAYFVINAVKIKGPKLKIVSIQFEGKNIFAVLESGTKVRFDPKYPVPVWVYPFGIFTTNDPTYHFDALSFGPPNKVVKVTQRNHRLKDKKIKFTTFDDYYDAEGEERDYEVDDFHALEISARES